MKRLHLLVTIVSMLPIARGADLRVDHATIAGTNLENMQDEFKRAGFAGEYGGEHPNQATRMAVISFADGSYLELISAQQRASEKALDAHPWGKFIRSNAGPCAWAVRPSNLAAEVARLRGSGLAATDPADGGRERPDGTHLEWQTAQIQGDRGAFLPFMIHDVTARDMRVYASGRPTAPGFAGISKVVIAVGDLDTSAARYRKAFGLDEPAQSKDESLGARLATFEGTPVVLAAALQADNWLAARVRKYGDAPCAFVIRRVGSHPSGKIEWVRLKATQGRIGIE